MMRVPSAADPVAVEGGWGKPLGLRLAHRIEIQ